MRHLTTSFFVLATTLASASAQQTWTVAAGGGAQFVDIGAAVAAASDGDVILVGPGSYAPFAIDGKGLIIVGSNCFVGNSSFAPFAAPPVVTIRNVAANQHVHLSGMQLFNFAAPAADLLVHDCLGTVWLEDLFCDSYGAPALRVERCSDVVSSECFLQTNLAAVSPSGTPLPGPGARVVDSRVFTYDTDFRGSHGPLQGAAFPVANAAADGGNGLEIVDSQVAMQGGSAHGGTGSVLFVSPCTFGGNGGDGVVLAGAGGVPPELRARGVVFAPGPAAWSATCGATPVDGLASRVLAGQIVALAGDARLLTGGGGFVAPGLVTIDVLGVPGDAAFLFASMPAPAIAVAGLTVHVSAPPIALGFAFVDGTGRAHFPIALPSLPVGAPTFAGAMQAVVLDGGGGLLTTGPATIVVR